MDVDVLTGRHQPCFLTGVSAISLGAAVVILSMTPDRKLGSRAKIVDSYLLGPRWRKY